MFQHRIRNLVLALSIVAAVGSTVAGPELAAAASIPAADPAQKVQYELVPAMPKTPIPWVISQMWLTPSCVGKHGRNTYYTFRIQAVAGTLKNVSVRTQANFRWIANNGADAGEAVENLSLGTFSAPDYRDVTVSCFPPAGAHCSSAIVNVDTTNGLHADASNDTPGNKS